MIDNATEFGGQRHDRAYVPESKFHERPTTDRWCRERVRESILNFARNWLSQRIIRRLGARRSSMLILGIRGTRLMAVIVVNSGKPTRRERHTDTDNVIRIVRSCVFVASRGFRSARNTPHRSVHRCNLNSRPRDFRGTTFVGARNPTWVTRADRRDTRRNVPQL